MGQAVFRFYASLGDFLPPERRGQTVAYSFLGRPAVKDAIEALGIPHVEVELILANSQPVPFSYHLEDGDRIAVYPPFKTLDISSLVRAAPPPLPEPGFVCDVHLRKLARILRLLGLDVAFVPGAEDEELISISNSEQRILLTRDRELLKHGRLRRGYWVRSEIPREQAREVIQRFDLREALRPFSRCPECGGPLVPVEKSAVLERIPPRTAAWLDEYMICQRCGKLYWRGSHFRKLDRLVREIMAG